MRRAALLDCARRFFQVREVLEVETPAVLSHAVSDVQIEALSLSGAPPRYLQTSPEHPMKRLLCAGSGDIFQICRVFRAGERSRLHNPEFTMIEWYRLGMDLPAIMEETAALAATLMAAGGRPAAEVESVSYREAFQRGLQCDPFTASMADLATLCRAHGLAERSIAGATRDDRLDFLVSACVGPALGRGRLTCLHHFPLSQAALARSDAEDPQAALRFELYSEGIELANGYVELGDAAEQRRRFEADLAERRRRNLALPCIDESLLAALAAGLPACAGVAMGFDRVAMLALSASCIDEVMAFPWDRA